VEAVMADKKRNYNPNSRNNLVQFQTAARKKRQEDITKEILGEVEVNEELLELVVAAKEICENKTEQTRFMGYVKEYLKEYSKKGTELTISDIDDIATLCMNNIMITRMYKTAKNNADISVADVMASIDRLKKDNVKLKENLASTRKDRVDPKAGQIITVSDLISEYEQERHARRSKLEDYLVEEEEVKNQCHTSVEDMIT
jgi:hypothetical protein